MISLVKRSTNNAEHESHYQAFIRQCNEYPLYDKLLLLRLGSRKDDAHKRAFEIMTDPKKERNKKEIQNFIKWLLQEV